MKQRNRTRIVPVGNIKIGGDSPIAIQSMSATRTQDIEATIRQLNLIHEAGADLIRIAIDSKADVKALSVIREQTQNLNINLSVDLQENYRLISDVAPLVDKVRYNPGHLHHHEKDKTISQKVEFIASIAFENNIALRIGVNCGSVDPILKEKFGKDDVGAMVESALQHTQLLDDLGFYKYVVSLKDSDWRKVIEGNRRFASIRPEIPLHLGVTEAGMPPEGIIKTRVAFEQLISEGIGDTVRVSLTLPFDKKGEEVTVAREILKDIENGRYRSVPSSLDQGLNIISCPSCSRVENEKFIELAQQVKVMSEYAKNYDITVAVMGCRVNGPGETDDADIGMWCGPLGVNLKRGEELIGHFGYDTVLDKTKNLLDEMINEIESVKQI
mgnify:CR=1 FL=1|tara:strand:- start:10603 stop:11757 length:1155 start_codon:yes stop_codon:yes gene_type:complete